MDMDEKTFQELVTAYGGDARRWPDDRRAAMQAFQDAHPQARAIVSCAAALDDWLEARLPDASADLHARISADMSKALAATEPVPIRTTTPMVQGETPYARIRQTAFALGAMAACLTVGIVNAPMLIDFIFGAPDPLTMLTMVGDEMLFELRVIDGHRTGKETKC